MKRILSFFHRFLPDLGSHTTDQPIMNTTIKKQDGKIVVILKGSLDTAFAAETEEAMSPLYDVTGKDIILDCTDLEYISSAGMRIFLDILQTTNKNGGDVYIKGIRDEVRHIFVLTGFEKLYKFI